VQPLPLLLLLLLLLPLFLLLLLLLPLPVTTPLGPVVVGDSVTAFFGRRRVGPKCSVAIAIHVNLTMMKHELYKNNKRNVKTETA
jgi:hypothetical protein